MIKPAFLLMVCLLISSCNRPPVVCQYKIVNRSGHPLDLKFNTIDSDSVSRKTIGQRESFVFYTTKTDNIGILKNESNLEIDSAQNFRTVVVFNDTIIYAGKLFHRKADYVEGRIGKTGVYYHYGLRMSGNFDLITFTMTNGLD